MIAHNSSIRRSPRLRLVALWCLLCGWTASPLPGSFESNASAQEVHAPTAEPSERSAVTPPHATASSDDATSRDAPKDADAPDDATEEAPTSGSPFPLGGLVALLVAIGLGGMLHWRFGQAATTMTYLGGMVFLFAGERLFAGGAMHWPLTLAGLAAVVGTLGMRARERNAEEDPTRREGQKTALVWGLVGASSLLLYLLTTTSVTDALGLDEDAAARWKGAWTALFPIVWLIGTLPMLLIDQALNRHPVQLPRNAARRAAEAGLTTALALALVFPVNYLAGEYELEYDARYFKTTEVGSATRAIARALPQPVEVHLFYPAGNNVREELASYFEELASSSDEMVSLHYEDQALAPALAEELKIRDNGYVAFRMGETTESLKIGVDEDKARRHLKTLDSKVQEHLLKLSKGPRVAYLMTGHGEANPRTKDDSNRKISDFETLLESQNITVKNFGLTEGSAVAVPDDATVVVIAGPEEPLAPEEVSALRAYGDRGGRLMVFVDPEGDPLRDLLGYLGLSSGGHPLAHESAYVRKTRGLGDRVFLVTNRFGSHKAVTTLSRNSSKAQVALPTVSALEKTGGGDTKISTLIRSMPDTWEDRIPDRQKGADERSEVFDLAVAVSRGGEDEDNLRAVVVGDTNLLSDAVLRYVQGNQVFVVDTLRWLMGEESLVGETKSEEDVRIQHTRDEDTIWFWSTIFAMPALILILGAIFVARRRSK